MALRFLISLVVLVSLGCRSLPTGSPTPIHIVDTYVDRLDRAYVLYSDNSLSTRTIQDLPSYTYANNRLGRISSLDVSNPHKILAFYQDYQQIRILDNTLSEVSLVDLAQLGFNDVRAIARSNDNQLWIYDAARYTLTKVDEDGSERASSINLTELSLNDLNPVYLCEQANKVYMVDPAIGIVIFDNFGQYLRLLPIKALQRIFVDRDHIIYFSDGQMHAYNVQLLEEVKIKLPEIADTSYEAIIPTPTSFVLRYRDHIDWLAR